MQNIIIRLPCWLPTIAIPNYTIVAETLIFAGECISFLKLPEVINDGVV
jgi:hypothetical protein